MKKIAIIGSPGAGKSTLACQLGKLLNIEVIHLDRYFWQSGWREKPRDARINILKDLVQKERWIIEGSYPNSSELRLDAADTIIFLDIPPLLCFQRLRERHKKYKGQSRPDLPDGCSDKLGWICILKVLAFPMRGRRTMEQKLRNYESKQIIWLRSAKEVEEFLAQQEQGADDEVYVSLSLSSRSIPPLVVAEPCENLIYNCSTGTAWRKEAGSYT